MTLRTKSFAPAPQAEQPQTEQTAPGAQQGGNQGQRTPAE
jgi:hypothetical protein